MPTRALRYLALATAITALTALSLVTPSRAHAQARAPAGAFTLAQVKSYPFPTELAAAATGGRIAWALDEGGRRNLWAADAPSYAPRQLTHYTVDDGQELTSVQLSRDGAWVVFVRGGDHGGNWEDQTPVNATSIPVPPKLQLVAVPFAGGEPKVLAENADAPAISPDGMHVAFVRDRQLWTVRIDGSLPAQRLLSTIRGDNGSPVWSPDGARLAFVSDRGDHAMIGVYTNDSTPIVWVAPSTSRDGMPVWSPDGARLAFVRRRGGGGAPDSALVQRAVPWSIWVADAASGEARAVWRSPATLRGSPPSTDGGANLHWGDGDRLVFLAEIDGWPHLYAMPAAGGTPALLTPGSFMAEHIAMSVDRRTMVFAANTGPDTNDVDRRHVVAVPVSGGAMRVLTPGTGLEWSPVMTGDGSHVALIGATAQRPPVPAVLPVAGGAPQWLGLDRIPSDFPTAQLVVPRKVVFRAPDGQLIHGQLFDAGGSGKRPAVVFVHGGPPRQMLLGWHYSDYYANTYALNQYLASRGVVVLSVNYRLGIGYGREFQHPPHAGQQGAAEYQDVRAGGLWLAAQPQVDAKRIGIYGGSYGGFLTALALGRSSDLFAAGVDIHGVHDWTAERARPLLGVDRYEKIPDAAAALATAWRSSPVASVATWRSPVLLIHGDDDRNVRFAQTTDLARRLEARHVPMEELIIPDDTHHMLRHANSLRVDAAAAEFLLRHLGGRGAPNE